MVAAVVAVPGREVAAQVLDVPVGFAGVNALGQNGTTGGAAGPTVTVSTAAQLADFAGRNTPFTILVAGRITFDDMITVVANKSIIGVGSTAEISGGGLQMGSTTRPGNNVIVRNLRFTNASDDSISVTNSAHHVWIDHNDFSNGFDGLLDIKRASDYVTVSWNHFHDHSKSALLGHSDTYTQDIGHLRVTYHHNFFDGTDQRHPRVRFGEPVHVFNNYYRDNSLYGVASTMNAGVLVEGNYFENVAHPSHVGYDKSGPGRLVARSNIFVNSGVPETAGTVVEPRTYYPYQLDNPADVPALVRAGAGVGRTGAAATMATAAAESAPVGFASVNALGQNGTTGGAGGPVVTATNTAQFLDFIARSGPLVVQVSGTITLPTGSSDGMHNVTSDKTIVGLGNNARLVGGGLNLGLPVDDDVTTPPPGAVHNVIIRNLTITGATDDLINVQMFTHHVWIDHNDLSNGDDGAIDIKRGSDFVTVSWNRIHDHDKTLLLGHDDDNGAQDIGRLRVTYHHNFFDGSDQRNPRVRFAEPVHVYNNYYRGPLSYGIASAMNAGVVAEGNYFDSVNNPGRVDFSGDLGRMVSRDNILVNCHHPIEVRGSVVEPRTYYSYTADRAATVPTIVPAGAGVGKI
ncbi:pectate lyase family protein [Actinophytocola sp.]|uniref:pectate lyase family protein n=1 Tax=Actinophytocola sp. TaxID=1872138 RepID=UPI002D7E6108|nr:right-handed parallel beta-helix repeat-containing protein [Actinophytocola sp.]HET9141446.1 right-handed parallel beta-helix repeat-containing protein [Actinophytocola sp.]